MWQMAWMCSAVIAARARRRSRDGLRGRQAVLPRNMVRAHSPSALLEEVERRLAAGEALLSCADGTLVHLRCWEVESGDHLRRAFGDLVLVIRLVRGLLDELACSGGKGGCCEPPDCELVRGRDRGQEGLLRSPSTTMRHRLSASDSFFTNFCASVSAGISFQASRKSRGSPSGMLVAGVVQLAWAPPHHPKFYVRQVLCRYYCNIMVGESP